MRGMTAWTAWVALAAAMAAADGAAAAPLNYDCDTGEGSYSEIAQVQPGPAYQVRGAIAPLQWRDHERWLASAQIRLENADRTRSIAVQVVRPQGAERADFGITVNQGGGARAEALGEVGLNEEVAFAISLAASGEATVSLGGERRALQLDLGRNARVAVICSTGEFEFRELDLGG